jgi:putative ABC transport system permease protein
MNATWRLALRNVFRNRARSGLTLAAIAAGVGALILAGGFVADIMLQLREQTIRSQLGHLQIERASLQARGKSSLYDHLIDDVAGVRTRLASLPHVTDAMGRLRFAGLLNNGRADLPVVGEGVEPGREARLGTALAFEAGRNLRDDDRYAAVLGAGLARALGLAVGDFATVVANTADGAMNTLEVKVVGVFRSMSRDYDNRALRLPLALAQELVAVRGAHTIVVVLDRTEATAATLERARALAPAPQYAIKTWDELADFYKKAVDLYAGLFGVLKVVALGMVLLGVLASVNMAVLERTAELGTLRAMGNRDASVFRLVLAENVLLGAAGAAIGVIAGLGIAALVSAIGIPMPPPPNADASYVARIQMVPSTVVQAFAIGLAGTVFAALPAAWRAAKLPIADALRQG